MTPDLSSRVSSACRPTSGSHRIQSFEGVGHPVGEGLALLLDLVEVARHALAQHLVQRHVPVGDDDESVAGAAQSAQLGRHLGNKAMELEVRLQTRRKKKSRISAGGNPR